MPTTTTPAATYPYCTLAYECTHTRSDLGAHQRLLMLMANARQRMHFKRRSCRHCHEPLLLGSLVHSPANPSPPLTAHNERLNKEAKQHINVYDVYDDDDDDDDDVYDDDDDDDSSEYAADSEYVSSSDDDEERVAYGADDTLIFAFEAPEPEHDDAPENRS